MTCALSQNVALDRIIAPWLVAMAGFFGAIFQFILAIVEYAGKGLQELDARCLLPLAGALDTLACKVGPEFKQAASMDLRGVSKADALAKSPHNEGPAEVNGDNAEERSPFRRA